MLTLVRRRALAQRRLLGGVLVLVVLGTTLIGVGALLLTSTQPRAFTEGLGRSRSQDVAVTAYLVDVGPDVARAREAAVGVLREVLAPLGSSESSTTVARLRHLDGDGGGLAYLASDDVLLQRAVLTSGRLPARPGEAVVPDAAASRLHLAAGDRLTLGGELARALGEDTVETPVPLVVVGTFRPLSRVGWESDPLSGAGYQAQFSDGSVTAPAYGPVVLDDAAFLATGSTVDSVQVVGRPELTAADDTAVGAVTGAVRAGSGLLAARVGDDVRRSRLASELPATVQRVRTQQAATRSTVVVVLLLATVLSVVALLLAGRLVEAAREDERVLLVSLGVDRRQLLLASAGESLALAVVAAALAVPAAAVAQSWLTHLPALGDAGLEQGPTVTGASVLSVLAAAVALALSLVVPVLTRSDGSRRPTWSTGPAARAGGDLLLAGVALAAWWQVRSAVGAGPATGVDVVQAVAPVLGLVAAGILVARIVPALLALVARTTTRSRSLLVPLALQQAARRPQAAAALLLVALAAGAATFALSVHASWGRSQDDQADLRVGTDLSLALAAPATGSDVPAVTAAAGAAPVVSPVVARPLALGRYLGSAGDPPVLVAVDSRRSGQLLRGRLDGGDSWSDVGSDLAPAAPVTGLAVPSDGAGLLLGGTAPSGVAVSATPQLVVQDSSGFRSTVSAEPVPLDGQDRPPRWTGAVGTDESLVAVRLQLSGTGSAGGGRGGGSGSGSGGTAPVSVRLTVPASTQPDQPDQPGQPWRAQVLDAGESPAHGASVGVGPDPAGATVVTTSTSLDLAYLEYGDGELLVTAFDVPPAVPVAVSRRLADEVGARVGGTLSATVAEVPVSLEVAVVVPDVPSAPGRVAVLADADTLSRALVAGGRLEPVVDAWWVADPPRGAAAGLRALDLGEVTTRVGAADALARGPLGVLVPTGLLVLVVAATTLLLVGAALVLTADQRGRAAEVARVRALGLSRRRARLLLLGEHAALLVPLVVLGVLLGALGAWTLGPGLVRSDLGAAPVPDVVVVWPWAAEASMVGGLLVGCLVVAAVVSLGQVRRSDTARLGSGE